MPEEIILADGMSFQKPSEKAPDFVKGKVSIKVDKLTAFLEANQNADGWVTLDLLESKKGSWYFKLNTWKPTKGNNGEGEPDESPDKEDPF